MQLAHCLQNVPKLHKGLGQLHKHIRALVMRRESLDRAPRALARLIGRDEPVPLPRTNVAEDKDYAELYRGFLDAIRVAPEVLDRAYSSRFARHFYSEEERAGFRRRWEGRSDG